MSTLLREESVPDMHIHTVDLKPWTEVSAPDSRLKAARELVGACHTTGFVYIKNYGILASLLEEAFSWSKKFYDLGEHERSSAAHPPGSLIYRGYSKLGHETVQPIDGEKLAGVPDYTESYGMGSDQNHEQPNVWLEDCILPGFRDFCLKFYAECWKTSKLILQALALGLELPHADYLLKFHSETENQLSLRHYPPVSESKVSSGEADRLGAHTDFDSFTLLWQDSLGGLKVKHPKAGIWIDAPPIEGTLIMNIGDVLSRWSNDYLTSTLHRVHLPPFDDSYEGESHDRVTKSRFSIPYFVAPKTDTLLQCLDSPFADGQRQKHELITFQELCRQKTEGVFKD
ncbi:hypothetical protein QTJ16_002416 [Diplocarpon rosae]|uniref:Fe2OG dioxygenase domain-containing protein n=1 Tax=Diplocarpon rosae TaxID=946125 RepID=A0AAD9T3U3_9HELO|nr:hypothetical protein QTJ16_002416 [Diplocarpon rosae]